MSERSPASAPLSGGLEAAVDSEARFRELADNISQFAWTADRDGWRYWFNKRWYDYTGATLEAMQGWGWQTLHHPDHVDRVLRSLRHSLATGTPWEDTFPLRGRDGTYRWFLSRALPIRDDAGTVVRWFGTNTDVTAQIDAERELRELNATLEKRIDAASQDRLHIWNALEDLLVVAELEGRFVSVNPAWTATLGWTAEELLGQSFDAFVHPDDRERSRALLGRIAAGFRRPRYESLRHTDGSYRSISWRITIDRGRFYAVGRDVTEIRAGETRLREARRELSQVARRTALAASTASIAHEINQPLSAIAANADAALMWLDRDAPDLDEVRAALQEIVAVSHRASGILAGIRALFRKDSHDWLPIDVNALVGDVLALAQGELDGHRVAVHRELPDALPGIVGQRAPLQQVLLNLITNAIDAMSALTDRAPQLAVRTDVHKSGDVVITVADCGTGIDAKDLSRIFDSFFTTKPQGMGMGLSICLSIVEAHGGRLWATPGAPHGTVFHVRLPRHHRE